MTQDIDFLIVKAKEALSDAKSTFGKKSDEAKAVQRALENIFGLATFAPAIGTWEDLRKAKGAINVDIGVIPYVHDPTQLCILMPKDIDKADRRSAVALLKIRRLIAESYDGNPTIEDRIKNAVWQPTINNFGQWDVIDVISLFDLVAFHTEEAARRFIGFPENCELLDEYSQRKNGEN